MLEQRFHDESRVVRHVFDDDAQQVVHLAGQRRTFDDLEPSLNRGLEHVHRIALVDFGVLFEPHVDLGGQAETDPFRRDQRDIFCAPDPILAMKLAENLRVNEFRA